MKLPALESIDLVRSLHGPKLLRLKGIVKIAEEPGRPLLYHARGYRRVEPGAGQAKDPGGSDRDRV